jgi:DNA topoisomerase-1
MGVGRPSTYASILDTVQSRGYVWKKGSALVPSWTAFAVIGLLERHFGELVDYGFTASMEEDLDGIANGEREMVPWLTRFYFGASSDGKARPGLKKMVSEHLGEIDAREVNSIPIGGPDSGIVVRVGRYGPYIQRGEERASLPEDLAPDELTEERAGELLATGSSERELGIEPGSGLPVVVKAGRYGPYVQAGSAEEKPRTASLFQTMDPATVTLEEALQLLSLPRLVGVHPDGEEVVATNGRYGPYLKKGSDSRSLESEDQLFSVTLDDAVARFAQPKTRGRGAAAAPLRELGADPQTGMPILLKEGRFGPYVTDGTTNASLRKGDTVDGMTPERAAELLADRRSAPPRAGRAKKAGVKKAAGAKKATGVKKAAGTRKASGAKKAGAVRKSAAGAKKAGTAAKKSGTAGAKKSGTAAKKGSGG